MKVINSFIKELNDSMIGQDIEVVDAYLSDSNEITVELKSDHNVSVRGQDDLNSYVDFINSYFNSGEWEQTLLLTKTSFTHSKLSGIQQKLNEEYHEKLVSDNESRIRITLEQELEKFLDEYNYEEIDKEEDGDEDQIIHQKITAFEYSFNVIFNKIIYFPEFWIMDRWEAEKNEKYPVDISNHVMRFTNNIDDKSYVDNIFMISMAAAHSDSITVNYQISGYYAKKSRFNKVMEGYYQRSDYKRFVKFGMFSGQNPEKMANNWNNLFYSTIEESEHFSEFKSMIRRQLKDFAERQLDSGKISEDQYEKLVEFEIVFKQKYIAVFDENEIAERASTDKEKLKKRRG